MRRSTPFSSRSVRSALTFRTATLLVVLGLAGAVPAISGVSYYLVTDVPATLGGIDYTPDQILRSDTSIYSVELNFGDSSVQFLALHRLPDGKWLLVSATPVDDGTSGIEPRDVVLFDGKSAVDWATANAVVAASLAGYAPAATVETGDGTVRRFGPGDVMLAEDTTGRGHITRVVGNQPRHYVFIPLK